MSDSTLFVFPKWSNKATVGILLAVLLVPLYLGGLLAYAANPYTLNLGYQPVQPVPYSHALHVGKLGLDCRYCHTTVEDAAWAAVPSADICMNCHKMIWTNSTKLTPVFESYATGKPVPWVTVYDLPDYVYFNHAAHVNAGVSCVECHGQVNEMEVMHTVTPLNMAWCISCHRDPAPHIRPRDQVTNLNWKPPVAAGESLAEAKRKLGERLMRQYHINPNTDCVTCHR